MIQNKKDLIEYLEADRLSLGRDTKRPSLQDIIWRYEIVLRKCEYYSNTSGGVIHKILLFYFKYRKYVLGMKCNYTICVNCFDKGLSLAHIGPVIVNSSARIGVNCRIHVGVNIGTAAGTQGEAPIIGDNVYIGPGAKIFGKITIGDNVAIGANAVVNKTFEDNNITIAGVPAKIINHNGSEGLLIKGSEMVNMDIL